MKNVLVMFWSGTGNTEKMAELIAKGAQDAGASVKLSGFELGVDLSSFDVIAMGCPAMGAEILEESIVQPFVDDSDFSGKKVALFGSYDWGDGEWMRDWENSMDDKGALVVGDPLIVNNAPEGGNIDQCVSFGKSLAE